MFFVVTTGRSGSKTFAQELSALPGCKCRHEPVHETICAAPKYRYGEMTPSEIQGFLRDTRKPYTDRGQQYGESDQNLSLIIPELARVFPEAKFIWLVRNGIDVVASWATRGDSFSCRPNNYESLPPHIRMWYDCRIQGDRAGAVPAGQWACMNEFERWCWYWSYINRLIEQDLKTHAPDRYRLVRLEESDVMFKDLARWLGHPTLISGNIRRHNQAKHYEPKRQATWTETESQAFEHWCGPQMDQLYPSWRERQALGTTVTYVKRRLTRIESKLAAYPRVRRRLNQLYFLWYAIRNGTFRLSYGLKQVA